MSQRKTVASSAATSSGASDETLLSPFKKAKYAWQIKGRGCYTKNPTELKHTSEYFKCDTESPSSSKHIFNELHKSKSEHFSNKIILNESKIESVQVTSLVPELQCAKTEMQEPNYECDANNGKKQSFLRNNPYEKISDKDKFLSTQSATFGDFRYQMDCNWRYEDSLFLEPVQTSMPNSFFPAYLVAQCMDRFFITLNHTNYSLRKWQTKQIAKGIIDNAINKVLEEIGFTPHASDGCISGMINSEYTSDISPQNIENEGVAEAIRQQGLQRRYNLSSSRYMGGTFFRPSGMSSAAGNNLSMLQNSFHPGVPCTCWLYHRHSPRQTDTISSVEDISGEKLLPHQFKCQSHNCNKSEIEENAGQDDLLNAAVTFAISEKGLGILTNTEAT